jgi:hypothetical protein
MGGEMDDKELKQYLEDFEAQVILKGLQDSIFGRKIMIPVKKGKLDKSDFGNFIGGTFDCNEALVIDYYGLLKKSTGFAVKLDSYEDVEVKRVRVPVAHFASIKIEHIADLAPDLVVNFPTFKKHLVKLRGFKNG